MTPRPARKQEPRLTRMEEWRLTHYCYCRGLPTVHHAHCSRCDAIVYACCLVWELEWLCPDCARLLSGEA